MTPNHALQRTRLVRYCCNPRVSRGWWHAQVCVVGHEDQRDEGLPLGFERLVQAARKDPAE